MRLGRTKMAHQIRKTQEFQYNPRARPKSEQIPLLDQPTKRLCHPDARDNMMLTFHKMDLELDILLGKPLGHLSGGEEDLIATDDGDSKQRYSHSPKLLAQLASLAKGKVSEEGTMSVKQLEQLQRNIKKTKTRMGREIWG
ncbi:MAG: hypothetical protein Q9192_008912 [Flavoplaca navasiana]